MGIIASQKHLSIMPEL